MNSYLNAENIPRFVERVFAPDISFDAAAEALWAYQYAHNPVMKKFCQAWGGTGPTYMPIGFFKQFDMKTGGDWQPVSIFESSGTTGQVPSRHPVKDMEIYVRSVLQGWEHFFEKGPFRILALLPSYLERGNASLVQMVKILMDHHGLPGSGFYLRDFEALERSLTEGMEAGEPLLLIGVAFALWDFAAFTSLKLPTETLVIETGGMKGRRKEVVREALHDFLSRELGVQSVISEYGMTELFSQAYARDGHRFQSPPWMQVKVSDIHLPEMLLPPGYPGRLLITDLANLHTCSFIATEDIGLMHEDGSFEVLGRIDTAEMRGCSLMYS